MRGEMANKSIRILDVFIDESEININDKPSLIFGIVIPRDLNKVASDLVDMKKKYDLSAGFEIKWALRHPDPEKKIKIKDDMVGLLAENFLCMINITEGRDKDEAFINVLRQIEMFMQATKISNVNIHYDKDSFRDINKIKKHIDSWKDINCTALACMDSGYSVGIQFADMLAGVFRYMIKTRFSGPSKTVKYIDDGLTEEVDVELDQLFGLTLRWSMWGRMPNIDLENVKVILPEHQTQDCFGTGVIVNGNFNEEEVAKFKSLSLFYRGCMH